jgi:hypothetical protein
MRRKVNKSIVSVKAVSHTLKAIRNITQEKEVMRICKVKDDLFEYLPGSLATELGLKERDDRKRK